jgi:hypothetical protein
MCGRGASKKSMSPPTYIQPSATDHDFVDDHIIPSVIVVGVIPHKLDGNWYDVRMVIVTLKNQPFEPSSATRHAVETSQNVIGHQQAPIQPIMVVYTDGGPGHRTNFITVILAAVGLFIKENLDILVQMRTPPGWSIRNVAERVMSIINCRLYGWCVVRKQLGDDEEAISKGCGGNAKYGKKAEKEPEVKKLLKESCAPAIEELHRRLSQLTCSGTPLRKGEPADHSEIKRMFELLAATFGNEIDWSNVKKAKALKQPELSEFLSKHLHLTDYGIQLFKCSDESCRFHKKLRLRKSVFDQIPHVPAPIPNITKHYKSLVETLTLDPTGVPDTQYQPSLMKKKEKVAQNAAVSCDRLKKKRTKARQPNLCSACTIVTITPDKNTLVGCVKCAECAFPRLLYVSNPSTWREKGWENILREALSHVDYLCGGTLLEDDHPMVTMVGTQQELVCFQNIETQYYTQLAKLNPPEYIEKTCFSCAACAADDGGVDYVRDPIRPFMKE